MDFTERPGSVLGDLREEDEDGGEGGSIRYTTYPGEHTLAAIQALLALELSEPYSVWVYRYFLNQWPQYCLLAYAADEELVGVVMCKAEERADGAVRRGYIGMLAVDPSMRRQGVGARLVRLALRQMLADRCTEVSLETETCNAAALRFYERFGFVRSKLLLRYYSTGNDAYRLKLPIAASPAK